LLRGAFRSSYKLSAEDHARLTVTPAHAFGHTFGAGAVTATCRLSSCRRSLAASLKTTSIYVRTGKQRMLEAAARYYADDE
jgi:hypothetical protein